MEPQDRSLNAELNEGQTDKTYRKNHPDRGGVVEPTTDLTRSQLHPWYGYGFTTREAHPKVLPGGNGVAP